MSINSDMKKYTLQECSEVQNKSRQWVKDWVDVKEIEVTIYKINQAKIISNNIVYSESTHTGLSKSKDIEENINRIVKKDMNNNIIEVYEITDVNPGGRLAQLYLKRIEYNG